MENNKIKIIKIISDSEFIINAGSNQHVKIGTEFSILDKKGEEVKDPDTEEVLGYLDITKGEIHVTRVFPNMSIAKSETYTVGGLSASMLAFQSSNSLSGVTKHKSLNVDKNQISSLNTSGHSDVPIQIGDLVYSKQDLN